MLLEEAGNRAPQLAGAEAVDHADRSLIGEHRFVEEAPGARRAPRPPCSRSRSAPTAIRRAAAGRCSRARSAGSRGPPMTRRSRSAARAGACRSCRRPRACRGARAPRPRARTAPTVHARADLRARRPALAPPARAAGSAPAPSFSLRQRGVERVACLGARRAGLAGADAGADAWPLWSRSTVALALSPSMIASISLRASRT